MRRRDEREIWLRMSENECARRRRRSGLRALCDNINVVSYRVTSVVLLRWLYKKKLWIEIAPNSPENRTETDQESLTAQNANLT